MLISDKLPALALLDAESKPHDQTFYGDIAVALTNAIEFDFTTELTQISGMRLRFGTYQRVNKLELWIMFNAKLVSKFDLARLIDNQYVEIKFNSIFRPEKRKNAKNSIKIKLFCPKATADNTVALWCTQSMPKFINLPRWHHWQIKHLVASLALDNLGNVAKPQISIIIPVFNKLIYTYNCLLSILNTDKEICKEIIIIDNASSDASGKFLHYIAKTGIKIIANKINKGFVEACHQGAAIARGEFILLLNNDTQVQPGYALNLIKLMQTDSKIAIVGSKLIYPDGRLQEAGGIIFNDASGCNYGRLQDPSLAKFNQVREVDYCSGASLMIRRELWQRWGGFDYRYAPAYYEDTDLCFTARAKGYKVMYCPDSQVIHHEGITAGTDVTQGYKAYQVINQRQFYHKWQDILITKHCSPLTPVDDAAQHWQNNCLVWQQVKNPKLSATKAMQELPPIFHYWAHKYLLPQLQALGYANLTAMAASIAKQQEHKFKYNINILILQPQAQFMLEFTAALKQFGVENYTLQIVENLSNWQVENKYELIISYYVLHNLSDIDIIINKLQQVLAIEGRLIVADLIGNTGLFNESLVYIADLWAKLPLAYKFNALTQQTENWFINHDYSGFGTPAAQHLPQLLQQQFVFIQELSYANLITVFIGPAFGYNFDPQRINDVVFIDQVQALDHNLISRKLIKPTYILAVLAHYD